MMGAKLRKQETGPEIYSPINTIPMGRVAVIVAYPGQNGVGRLVQRAYGEDGNEQLIEINSTDTWVGNSMNSEARLLERHELIEIT